MGRERVQVGTVASWIDPCYYEKNFTPKIRGEITYLLHEQQIHAERGETYVHTAMRLESQRSVQTESQWRLDFEPQTQSIVLHSIKTRRGETETEHASLDRIQFLQRESRLEGFVIRGGITLLLLLEDVCPGDILEFSYTVINRPRLMPEYLTAFFALPMATEIGKYRFLIQHAERRAVKWKASSPKLVPKITTDNGEVCCYWMDVQFASPEPEPGAPEGHLMFPWIQVSDCPDWQTVARAVLDTWEIVPPGENLTRLIEEITSFSADPLARVTRAIELVQDSFRYLSVDLGFGGHVPTPTEKVVRRRYGDCKDLAFLLVQLLRALGVPARPVLVHALWRKSIASMLPAPHLFNHVVVEYEIGNEKRWVDATVKNQGGGALNRWSTDFGLGLPIDTDTTALAPVPKVSLVAGTYELKETFILDTAGQPSYLAVVITTTGANADAFRNEFANAGIDIIAKDRAQHCANRFKRVQRLRAMECRDDRQANEFVLAEAFEIFDTLLEHKPSRSCLFYFRTDFTAGLLLNPGLTARRHPIALPFPCHRTHTVEIEFVGVERTSLPLLQVGNQYFTFTRRSRTWPNLLKVTFSLETLADAIPPEKLDEHRRQVESIHEAGVIQLQLPSGYSRGRKRNDFGALPPPNPSRASNPTVVLTQKPIPANAGAEVPVPIPESVATQRTAEVAGLAEAKPMPPAADGSRFQAPPETRERNRASRRPRKLEKRCAFSFYFLLLSLVGLLTSLCLAHFVDKGIGGLILLFVALPSWIVSIILGIFGWKHLARFQGRYAGDTSKIMAAVSLGLGGLLGLILIPFLIVGICAGIDNMRAHSHRAYTDSDPLDFKDRNFVFHSPDNPWRQTDAKRFGPSAVLAFTRPEPMFFSIATARLELMLLDPRKRAVELSKNGLRKTAGSYHMVSEKEVTYNGLAGWQIETEVALQGHDFYFVQWIFATNGFGYELSTWGPPATKSALKDETSRLCEDFALTAPQQKSASSTLPE
jgi:hypothetical protein